MLTLHHKSATAPGSASCTLTTAELKAYPYSLLSSIATSCTTGGHADDAARNSGSASSSSSTVSINLKEVPGWPCSMIKPVEAAEVITALYRDGRFPLGWLEQQLAAAGSSTTGLHNTLISFLSFLNLPGSLLEWLPIKSLTLRHIMSSSMELLNFYYKAAAMQAVDSMLNYNPLMTCSSSSGNQRAAILLVTASASGSSSAPLDVFAVDVALSSSDVRSIAQASANSKNSGVQMFELSSRLDTKIDDGSTPLIQLSGVGPLAGGSRTLISDEWRSAKEVAAVDHKHTVFGAHLAEALLAAVSSSKVHMMFGVGTVWVTGTGDFPGDTSCNASVPVWVVSW